jgi:hypothetical protein
MLLGIFYFFYFSIINNFINVNENILFFKFSIINNCINVDGKFLIFLNFML